MNIINKTQLQKDLESIQKKIDSSEDAIGIAIDRLNDARKHFWSLPDDRLSELLQHLHDWDELEGLFTAHNEYADDLNVLADTHTEITRRAAIGRGRDFTITDGVVQLAEEVAEEPSESMEESPEV